MKALAEIYIIHTFAPLSDLNFFVLKIAKQLQNFAKFCYITFCRNFAKCAINVAKICRNFGRKSEEQKMKMRKQDDTEFCRNSNFYPLSSPFPLPYPEIEHFGACRTHPIVALATIS